MGQAVTTARKRGWKLVCHREDDLRIVLGRGNNANVFIYAAEHPSFVSRDHAEFFYESGAWQVADLASVNGVFVLTKEEKSRVFKVGREGCALQFGDRVFFGNPQHSFFVEYKFCQSPIVTLQNEEDQVVVNVTGGEVDLVPRDIWLFRILPFLDVASLIQCMQCGVIWRDRVLETMRHLTTLRWKYEWTWNCYPTTRTRDGRCTEDSISSSSCYGFQSNLTLYTRMFTNA
ncbi:hypothetical protein BASA81_002780 [Batrachochytrium salamandrivorans]|nr:hypothetical protein BASA81_002780 [Batrachochytrium salamandrivorans]